MFTCRCVPRAECQLLYQYQYQFPLPSHETDLIIKDKDQPKT